MIVSLALFYCVMAGNSFAYTSQGTLTQNETWSSTSSTDTLRIMGDITVTNNVTLTIQPGTLIRGYSPTDCYLRIINVQKSGMINAAGTAAQPIGFINVYLDFDRLTRDSLNVFTYCKFRKAWGHGFAEFRNPYEPCDTLSKITFDHCTFDNSNSSYCQVYVTSGASPTFNYCTFDNGVGNQITTGGIFIHGGGVNTFNYCTFSNMSAAIISGSLGGKLNSFPWEPMQTMVNHCTFYNITGRNFTSGGTAADGFGVCAVNRPGVLTVKNSIFCKLDSSGIRDFTREDAVFCCPQQQWTVNEDYNCYFELGGEPVRNMTMGAHSKELDPKLNNPINLDFSLQTGSPCLGTANDGTNMGAWQSMGVLDNRTLSQMHTTAVTVSENVFRDGVTITFSGPSNASVIVSDNAGRVVRILWAAQGRNSVYWNGQNAYGLDVASGIYFVTLGSGTAERIIKIR
jgi:hypothetical protein